MLVGDEFDLFAAQRMDKGDMRLLGAMEDIARRGRVKGIGLVAISQRPASIHKDVLSQLSVLIAHRLVGPHDRNAVDDWVAAHGTREERDELMSSIAALPPGEAWFWSPSWLQEFRRVAVLPSETFDSMATPKPGRRRLEPTVLSPVDIEALRDRLRGIVDVAEAKNPVVLQRRIGELERELNAAKLLGSPVVPQVVDRIVDRIVEKRVEIVPEGLGDDLARVAGAVQAALEGLQTAAAELATGQSTYLGSGCPRFHGAVVRRAVIAAYPSARGAAAASPAAVAVVACGRS